MPDAAQQMEVKRVCWDEQALEEHKRSSGVLWGRMKIEECPSPFLYYSESVSRDEHAIKEFVPGVGPQKINIHELQARLGALATDEESADLPAVTSPPVPDAPTPWVAVQSRSNPSEYFYYNTTTKEATWEMPKAPPLNEVPAETASTGDEADSDIDTGRHAIRKDEDEEEEVPLYSSRLATHGEDCATAHFRALGIDSRPSRE